MNKEKKQETIVVIIGIVFVSIMAGLKVGLDLWKILIVIVAFAGLYLLISKLMEKLLKPLYDKREKLNKNNKKSKH